MTPYERRAIHAKRVREWRAKNKQRYKAYRKAYREKNKEHERQKVRKYYLQNRDHILNRQRDYNKRNPHIRKKAALKSRDKHTQASKLYRINLADHYVKSLITQFGRKKGFKNRISNSEVPEELVKIKKLQLQLKRKANEATGN
jgi:hypothetical protein